MNAASNATFWLTAVLDATCGSGRDPHDSCAHEDDRYGYREHVRAVTVRRPIAAMLG